MPRRVNQDAYAGPWPGIWNQNSYDQSNAPAYAIANPPDVMPGFQGVQMPSDTGSYAQPPTSSGPSGSYPSPGNGGYPAPGTGIYPTFGPSFIDKLGTSFANHWLDDVPIGKLFNWVFDPRGNRTDESSTSPSQSWEQNAQGAPNWLENATGGSSPDTPSWLDPQAWVNDAYGGNAPDPLDPNNYNSTGGQRDPSLGSPQAHGQRPPEAPMGGATPGFGDFGSLTYAGAHETGSYYKGGPGTLGDLVSLGGLIGGAPPPQFTLAGGAGMRAL